MLGGREPQPTLARECTAPQLAACRLEQQKITLPVEAAKVVVAPETVAVEAGSVASQVALVVVLVALAATAG